MTALPTAEQVDQLPAELTLVVPPDFEDDNGHMNISHYFALQSRALGGLFRRIGYAPGPERRVGPFTLEQHLRYHHEILVGNVDLETRRLAAYDPPAGEALDRVVAEHARLEWDVPRPGPVGLRQRVPG